MAGVRPLLTRVLLASRASALATSQHTKHSGHTAAVSSLNAPSLDHSLPAPQRADSTPLCRSQLSHCFLQEAFPDLPTLAQGTRLLELPIPCPQSSLHRGSFCSGHVPSPGPAPEPGQMLRNRLLNQRMLSIVMRPSAKCPLGALKMSPKLPCN